MSELPVLEPTDEALAVLAELEEPLERRLTGPFAAVGLTAPRPIVTNQPEPLEVRYSERGTTLTAATYDRDPVVARDGGLIRAPDSEHRRLEALRDAGIDPDLIWILRELPGRWTPGDQPPKMVDIQTAATARTADIQHRQAAAAAFAFGRTAAYAVVSGLALATRGAVAVGGAALTVGAAVIAAPLAGGLDPIVLGGIRDPRTSAVVWVQLAAWDEIPDGGR